VKPRPAIPDGPVLVIGLARSGAAAALALHDRGIEVIGVDAGAPDVRDLGDAGIEVHTEASGVELLGRVRAVVKSPGVPGSAAAIVAARERVLPVLGELELGWRLLPNEFIAVSGTNGKTTTVELIGHIHREAGLAVAVAGNVGTALSGLAGELERRATVVCEASSFQLEDTLDFAPEAAVLLNVDADHLDRHGTFAAYLAAKLELFRRQGNDDVAVFPCDLAVEDIGGCARRVCFGEGLEAEVALRAGQLWWVDEPLLAADEIRLPGAHNVNNAMAAAAVCLARGVDMTAVRDGLRTFAGVPHRLERVDDQDGVSYVNDSKATNVASTIVALRSFAEGGAHGVHLIVGGQCKGQSFVPLRGEIERFCAAVYLIGEDAEAIAADLAGIAPPVRSCGDLEHAVARAGDDARAGQVVLLSPACASFDQFEDFEHRGDRFRELVLSRR
jgi:UDP-N-acetylmuramoylalanine--D-glutamate ligase